MDRNAWRLVGPMHIAETREKARENVRFGLDKWIYYFRDVAALPLVPEGDADPIDSMIASGMAVIGTPDDAIAQLERLQNQSGGFGCFLQMAHNWADWAQTQRSYELIARHVAPKFQGSNTNRDLSYGTRRRHPRRRHEPGPRRHRRQHLQARRRKGHGQHPPRNPRSHGHGQEARRRRIETLPFGRSLRARREPTIAPAPPRS